VSEFGIGPWRKANEDFLATFEKSYQLYEQRIGAPSSVDVATGGWLFGPGARCMCGDGGGDDGGLCLGGTSCVRACVRVSVRSQCKVCMAGGGGGKIVTHPGFSGITTPAHAHSVYPLLLLLLLLCRRHPLCEWCCSAGDQELP
jgi:hypothetical protein